MSLMTHGGGSDDSGGQSEDEADCAGVLAAAREATADIAVISDAQQAITYVSSSFTAMTGYEPDDLRGLNCRVLQGPGTDKSTTRRIRDLLASGEVFEGQILNYRKDGSAFWTALKIIPMRLEDGPEVTHYVSIQSDISNRVALQQQLESQALHDHVTGLPNRVAAEQAVLDVVRRLPHWHQDRGLVTAVGLIDLDDFRLVNNTLGHAAGDEVLQQWATRVLSRLRDGDVLARMGGDEFLLVLRNITRATSGEDLSHILERMHEAVEHPFLVDGQEVRIGMSLGIALVPEDGTDSRSILRSADEALYAAKERHGRGGSWWETAEYTRLHPLPLVISQIANHTVDEDAAGTIGRPGLEEPGADGAQIYRRAISSGNVLVHFQPVVDLRDGSVTLFEALARVAPMAGRVAYPDEFLPHLDADDLRVLFVEVLDQALDAVADWDTAGSRPYVAVNLPPEILHDSALPALVEASLRTHGIEPGRLSLELLESHTMELEEQRVALQELAGLGVHLAMDDLGSGYSSLQRLSSFPFTAIKLDRGLFLHVYDRPLEALSVMATLIQMGRDLSMTVVIEGLEDQSLTEAAMILGAPLGQGYHFARPMAREGCLQWFETFESDLHRSLLHTPLGALAYHWQFARLGAPHPLDLSECPLTSFIRDHADTDPDKPLDIGLEAESWHALQHAPEGMHPGSSRFLINWLIKHIHA
jgi:diguanylate cyclase (GGDEF)-like protein/PAS domain S-box-containing protein